MNKFLKTFDINVDKFIDPFTVYYGDVLYKEAEQYKEIKSFFDSIADVIRYTVILEPKEYVEQIRSVTDALYEKNHIPNKNMIIF